MASLINQKSFLFPAALVLFFAGCKEPTLSDVQPSHSSEVSSDDQTLLDSETETTLSEPQVGTASETDDQDTSQPAPPPVEMDKASPQYALMTFLVAINAKDEQTLRAVTVPTDDFDWLLKGEKASGETLERLKKETYEIIEVLHPGDDYTLADGKKTTVTVEDVTLDRALLLIPGAPEPISCVRIDGKWHVDAAPLIKARKIVAQQREQEQKSP